MFIRRTAIKSRQSGEPCYTHRLVETERVNGQVKQHTLLNLGRHFSVPKDQWRDLSARIQQLLEAQAGFLSIELPTELETLAQRYSAQLIASRSEATQQSEAFHSVNLDSMELVRPRRVAIEQLALHAAGQLKLQQKLQELGFNRHQQAAALGNIIARMAYPASERASHQWLQQRSGLGELIGYDYEAMGLERLYQASDLLWRHREALQAHLYGAAEAKTLEAMLAGLGAKTGTIVVMDAGIASEDNIQWLIDHGYRYLVVSRKRKRDFDPNEAITVKDTLDQSVRVQRVVNEQTGEVELYCHSEMREKKEQAIQGRFAERFEIALQSLSDGLHKKGTTKRHEKVLERIGRLKEKYARAAQHYEITAIPNPETDKTQSIHWKRQEKPNTQATHPGVYCLRANIDDWDEERLWKTYIMLTDLEAVFRSLKSELGMRPIYHHKEERVSGHIFITLLAYHLVHTLRLQLKAGGIHDSWHTLRCKMENQQRVTAVFQCENGKTVHLRKSTRAEPEQQQIYDALGVTSQAGCPHKTWV